MSPAHRIVSSVTGLVLLAAVALKLESPAHAATALAHALRPLFEPGQLTVAGLTLLLILTETALGAAMILRPSRAVRAASALTFLVFAIVLVIRFTAHDAPPCGCLGRLFSADTALSARLDAGRNIMFALALLLTLPDPPVESTPPLARPHDAASRPAFTLTEALVTIAIIAIILAIVIPVLARARTASKVSRSLAAQQQIVAALHIYGQTHKDFFPHFEPLAGVKGPVRIRGTTVMEGYFRAHMGFWLAAVGPDDEALINLAIWPPRSRQYATAAEEAIGLYYSVYYMSPTVAADPTLFTDLTAQSPSPDPSLLRAVRWDEMTFPARKGLFIDFSLFWTGRRDEHIVAAFGDASAAVLPSDAPPEPIVPQPAQGPRTIVISTRNGIRGVDR